MVQGTVKDNTSKEIKGDKKYIKDKNKLHLSTFSYF